MDQLHLQRDVDRAIELLDTLQKSLWFLCLLSGLLLTSLAALPTFSLSTFYLLLLYLSFVACLWWPSISIGGDSSAPGQHLHELKRVLQSDFFNSVREVYENIYSTVELQGNIDARAHATAKVGFTCLRAEVAYNEYTKMKVKFITLSILHKICLYSI